MKSLYFNFAIKSLISRAKQYRSLFAVCVVGVCVMLSVLMTTDGMIDSMTEKMRQYYGGDFMILSDNEWHLELLEMYDGMIAALKEILPKGTEISYRYKRDSGDKSLFFEGVSVKQRSVQGVDFSLEKALFEKFNFVEGGIEVRESHDTLLLSEPAAKKLGVHIGDNVVLLMDTPFGQNTVTLVVTGIFQDSSVFGMYTSYIDYQAMKDCMGFTQVENDIIKFNVIDKICVYYPNGAPTKSEIARVQAELEKRFDMFPLSYDKTKWQDYDVPKDKKIFALIPLSANVSDLQKLSMALRAIVVLIVVMLVIIISVGISSTFRVIVLKRAVESGTFRALGMKPKGLMALYFTEILLLLVSGSATGFAASLAIAKFASSYNLSFISGFDLFLTGGHLAPVLHFGEAAFLLAVIFVTTLGAVLFTLRKLVHISPVGALATVA
ncbi:MAG: FtsX-like permease family protein [Treponema sp.]|nr:FtsX-like permease family protein [Treponema sp.]